MLIPKLVAFIVPDVRATVSFYEAAFQLKLHYMHPTSGYAELASGATVIAFLSEGFVSDTRLLGGLSVQPNRPDAPATGAHVAFWSDDIDRDWATAVESGATIVSPLERKPWGQIAGYLRDMDGIVIEMCTPSVRAMPQ